MEIINDIKVWLEQYPVLNENLKFIAIILLALTAYFITKKIILKYFRRIIRRTTFEWDDIIFNDSLLNRISLIPPIIILHQFIYLLPDAETFLGRILSSVFVIVILLIIGAVLNSVNNLYEKIPKYKDRSIKGYVQLIKIILYILGIIIIIGILTAQEPWTLITGLGAITAILLLVFRDTILSFVASIQISSYDLIKKGDWIEVQKYGADGDVIDIALHTVKVQNWDKTITVIPTYKLIEESFKNWRGMKESGGRRIKRSIHVDINSVKFLDDELYNKLSGISSLRDYLKDKKEEIDAYNQKYSIDTSIPVNGRRLTNIGTFRAYLREYLRRREDTNNNLTFLVRHLAPSENGIPIEIYMFTNTTVWGEYEDIQSDIFDHIFAVVHHFELSIFQNPSGNDFRRLINNE